MNVDKIAGFINRNKTVQKVLRATSDNPALVSAGISFISASIMRPTLQSFLPIKDKDDKIYTMASSVATGVTELGLACAIFIPSKKVIDKTSKELYSSAKQTIYQKNPELLRQYKSLSNRFLKLGLLPLTSWARFAAIAPMVKLLFKRDNKPEDKGNKNTNENGGKLNVKG